MQETRNEFRRGKKNHLIIQNDITYSARLGPQPVGKYLGTVKGVNNSIPRLWRWWGHNSSPSNVGSFDVGHGTRRAGRQTSAGRVFTASTSERWTGPGPASNSMAELSVRSNDNPWHHRPQTTMILSLGPWHSRMPPSPSRLFISLIKSLLLLFGFSKRALFHADFR